MKVLITGATGMLGRATFERLSREPGASVSGLCHSRVSPGLHQADLTDLDSIAPLLDSLAPDAIVHTAAIRKPDEFAASAASSRRLNVDATAAIARWIAAHPAAHLVYISSDYVFNGTAAPYSTDAPLHPANSYGQSKADGELVLRDIAPAQSAILRVPILYGDVVSLDESSVTSVITAVQKRSPVVLDDWAIRYPTHVADVADILAQMVSRRLVGTYHWSGLEPFTKYDMGLEIARQIGSDPALLRRSGAPANGSEPRPKDCHLDRSALESLGVTTPGIPFTEGIRRILTRFPG